MYRPVVLREAPLGTWLGWNIKAEGHRLRNYYLGDSF